ncbi:MAG TPA: DUF6114 domain-containing protein [Candidatus Limnocylindrales bacterium]
MTFWQRFRSWRRSRPFWGGLLTMLAGLEIVASMNLELQGGKIAVGQEGFTAYLIAFALFITGPLAWFLQAQRHFYGLIATFVAVYALIGVNLGGFFLGTLLGVAGGGLIFAWNHETVVDEQEASGVPPDDVEESPKVPSPRHAALILLVVAMSASMLAVTGAPARAEAADPCPPPAASPSPSPSPSPSGGGGGGGGTGIVGQIVDFFGRLITGGGGTPSPSASPITDPDPSPRPVPCPTSTGGPGGPEGPGNPGPGGTKTPAAPQAKLLPAAADQIPVGEKPSKMTGTRISMLNLTFQGVVDMPTKSGTIRSLKFTLNESATSDFLLHVYGNDGHDIDLRSSTLTVSGGGVEFYTSRFKANLGPIPVEFTPQTPPPPIPLPFEIVFTDPDIELVWVKAPKLEADDLKITLA